MCTGKSMLAAMNLAERCGAEVVGIAGIFTEGRDWEQTLAGGGYPQFVEGYRRLCHIPMFVPDPASGKWVEQEGT
jgi:hypothetical protein